MLAVSLLMIILKCSSGLDYLYVALVSFFTSVTNDPEQVMRYVSRLIELALSSIALSGLCFS
jgi:hypothetical protein